MYFPNFNSQRAFDSLTHMILTYKAMEIGCIEDKINEMDIKDEEDGGQALKSLPFNRERFITGCLRGDDVSLEHPGPDLPDHATQKENLFRNAEIMLQDYRKSEKEINQPPM
ncbi:hypothetical protein F4779DRAFT_610809 [Xylariaceae sp. FL0662B]|nr:hypothetical protein F4779DRAFT_610809 [Xylariaceae sp. FL0662B]